VDEAEGGLVVGQSVLKLAALRNIVDDLEREGKQITDDAKLDDARYWIALNGSSCALFSLPLRNPKVTPTPQQLLGFPTLEEAKWAQNICLTAQMSHVKKFMKRLRADVLTGRIRHIRPQHPQPPTRNETIWTEHDDMHQIVQQVHIKATAN
jgi:hypothetical protein